MSEWKQQMSNSRSKAVYGDKKYVILSYYTKSLSHFPTLLMLIVLLDEVHCMHSLFCTLGTAETESIKWTNKWITAQF